MYSMHVYARAIHARRSGFPVYEYVFPETSRFSDVKKFKQIYRREASLNSCTLASRKAEMENEAHANDRPELHRARLNARQIFRPIYVHAPNIDRFANA